ncbi:amino acid ABC transporter permease [Enterovirga sp. CN4-39]|uniref:amino acid ABC transporter permease n=1 Tax=Enterovirga sp. CN4-39 TaxID=3400910 RepID=UPI003BFDD885
MGNWERLVWNQRHVLLDGLLVTLQVCGFAFAAAVIGGLVLCLVRLYVPLLRPVAIALIEFFRGTPIFVQLVWVNYVWPEVFGWPTSFFTAGWVALALQSAGYLAETFRAGIEGIPRGHSEAATSLGMSRLQTLARIVLPQTLLATVPALINQVTVIIKSSTLVSVITVPDLMFQSQRIVNRYYEPLEVLTATAAIYIAMIFALSTAGNRLAGQLRGRLGYTV